VLALDVPNLSLSVHCLFFFVVKNFLTDVLRAWNDIGEVILFVVLLPLMISATSSLGSSWVGRS